MKEYFSPTALACKLYQEFENLNSFPTYSALQRTESSIFVSAFFYVLFIGAFILYVRCIVVYSKIYRTYYFYYLVLRYILDLCAAYLDYSAALIQTLCALAAPSIIGYIVFPFKQIHFVFD